MGKSKQRMAEEAIIALALKERDQAPIKLWGLSALVGVGMIAVGVIKALKGAK